MSELKPSKVSVIVVVHETYIPYLPTALSSLKSQSLRHEIIIIANGCSVDCAGVVAIEPSSLSHACNVGIELATGDYIVRLDADDWIDSILLEQEAQILDDNPEIDCVWCDYIQADTAMIGDGFETFILSHLPQMSLEHACGAMFRKSVWEELGGYDEGLDYQEAFDFWCRFHDQGYKAQRLPVPMYLYRRGHASMSTNPKRDQVRASLEEKYK